MVSIVKADREDLDEILRLQYLAYQSEAALFGNMDIPPLKQTIDEVICEYEQGIILKMICEDGTLPTVKNDNELRSKVSKEWSELNGVEISPEMINCTGCRMPGVKTVYCDSLCPIRQCAMQKQVENCGDCPEMKSCEKVGAIIGNNADARDRL